MPLTTAELVGLFGLCTKCLTIYNVLVSIPLYILVLRFIRRNWHKSPFNSPFFTKYSLYILKKCSYWDIVPQFFLPINVVNIPATLLYFIVWQLSFMQYELNILIAFNRFVGIMFPTVYRRVWGQNANRLFVVTITVLATCIGTPVLWQPICFQPTTIIAADGNVTKLTGPVFMNIDSRNAYYLITKIHNAIVFAILFFGYPLMLLKIRKLNLKDKLVAVEVRMLVSSVFLLAANALYIAYFFAWDALVSQYRQYGYYAEWCLYLILDVYDMMGPYAILLTTPAIRSAILPCQCHWGNGAPKESQVSAISTRTFQRRSPGICQSTKLPQVQ